MAEIATASPAPDAPKALLTAIVAVDDTVMDAVATIPLRIAFAFIPDAMHTGAPALPAQLRDLPADVNAGPATTLKLVTMPVG